MWDTFADAAESAPHPYDVDRYATVAAVRNGTTLVGVGSVERYRAGILALQIRGERYLEEGPGFGVNLEVFPPTGDDPPGSFLRGEIFGGAGVAHWEGDVPGSVVVGAGVGADALEVGDAAGRFYGLLRGRVILFLRPEVTTSLVYEALPFILSPTDLAQHQHRIELATGHGLLELGPRVAFTFRDGGLPARSFSEQTFGFFVGVGSIERVDVAAVDPLVLAATASLAPTCERTIPVRSTDVATRDTELHLTIDGDATSTRWRVWMLGPGGPVQLEPGDRLLVDGLPMAPAGDDHVITTPPGTDRATLVYAREGDAEDVTVDVELPPLAAIELPVEVRRGAPLVVRWAPAPGRWATIVRVEGSCLAPIEVRLPPGEDDGAVTIDLEGVERGGCGIDVWLTRLVARELPAPPLARAPSRILRATEATITVVD